MKIFEKYIIKEQSQRNYPKGEIMACEVVKVYRLTISKLFQKIKHSYLDLTETMLHKTIS